ncbi:MAG: cytochrome c biogenesis protein CcsA, partial [Bacteriovoracaceae bacterium]|nr:cytochrome c biogenesis protein CcsA [Bacteriovoracaceae bacterium]
PLFFALSTVAVETVYITLRVIISGRAPVTNMYETVLFSGFAALILSLIVGHFKKDKQFIYVGLMYNFLTLMMTNFAGGMLSSSISPLVPVLRDNFWLSTHVTSIIMSYGALALSWILANTALIKARVKGISKAEINKYTDQIYTCLKYGIILLALGIILGGIWADYSWGRFWGWDPKETWSLIVLCIYMAIIHGKYTSWISPSRFIPLIALAFLSVMMAWFGVNYILASGLHSYGFSEGGAIFLGSFFITQFVILAFTLKSISEKFNTNNTNSQIQENPA